MCRRGRVRQGKSLDLRDGESRMSHTAMQEVFIKTVYMLCKQQRRYAHLKTNSCYVTETIDKSADGCQSERSRVWSELV